MGLAAFQPGDADRFFGREQLTDDLVARVRDRRFVAVALVTAATATNSRTRVVLGVRADFYAHCSAHGLQSQLAANSTGADMTTAP